MDEHFAEGHPASRENHKALMWLGARAECEIDYERRHLLVYLSVVGSRNESSRFIVKASDATFHGYSSRESEENGGVPVHGSRKSRDCNQA